MHVSLQRQSIVLAALGLALLAHPTYLIGHVAAEPYEVELAQWAGVAMIALAPIRPWALRAGGWTRIRMRNWSGAAATSGVLYLVVTSPFFLVVGFATLLAAVIDASVERATVASNNLFNALRSEAGGR